MLKEILFFVLGIAMGISLIGLDLSAPECYPREDKCILDYEVNGNQCCRELYSMYLIPENPFARELPSPSDFLTRKDIKKDDTKVIIYVNDTIFSTIADTNSMDPVIDNFSNILKKKPSSVEDIHVGDIISYKLEPYGNILHRVVEIGEDKKGWYCLAKGDNNLIRDPFKVRFDQISGYVVAIFY